jgi:hypothetical protein
VDFRKENDMPIVGEGDGVNIEYTIPEDIKKLITYDFLKEFRNQLIRIHEYWSIETFAEEGIPTNTSTGGWYAALGKACIVTNSKELFKYWKTLPWYDSDIFDGELAEMLITNHLILDDLEKVFKEQLRLDYEDIKYCCDCGKLYTKEMVIELSDKEAEDEVSKYRCLYCNDLKNTDDGNKHATKYYQDCYKEVDEYNWQ